MEREYLQYPIANPSMAAYSSNVCVATTSLFVVAYKLTQLPTNNCKLVKILFSKFLPKTILTTCLKILDLFSY